MDSERRIRMLMARAMLRGTRARQRTGSASWVLLGQGHPTMLLTLCTHVDDMFKPTALA